MNRQSLALVERAPPSAADRSRERLRAAEMEAAEAVKDALLALDNAKASLDSLNGLPIKPGVLQTAQTLSRAILAASNTIVSLEGRGP